MVVTYAEAGNAGGRVRSDCLVRMVRTSEGAGAIRLTSKVEALYGNSIRALVEEMLRFFDVSDVEVTIEDSGAVPFVIMARVESVIRKLGLDNGKRFLPSPSGTPPASTRERFRRSRLYLPGNQPKLFLNAAIHGPDGLILDLEDSVAPATKEDARILVRNALRVMDFMGAERMVRINQLPRGYEDLREVVPHFVDCILIPKVESPETIREVEAEVDRILSEHGLTHPVFFMPIIESALGVIRAYDIATASSRIAALAIGLEDYTADIGVQRTSEGRESFYARSVIVNAARAAGVQPIDTVFSDVNDQEGLRKSVLEAKALGFDGKGCIHPRQIRIIHEAFAPSPEEIEKAKRIVVAFENAKKHGLGVVSLGSKMIDPPVVKRAFRVIELAVKGNVLDPEWREKGDE